MIKYYQLLFKKVLYQVWKRMSLTDTKSKIIRMCLKYSVIKERLDLSYPESCLGVIHLSGLFRSPGQFAIKSSSHDFAPRISTLCNPSCFNFYGSVTLQIISPACDLFSV